MNEPRSALLVLFLSLGAGLVNQGCSSDSNASGPSTPSDALPGGGTDPAAAPEPHSAVLGWQASNTRVDGSALSDLAGYVIHYGSASRAYTSVIPIGVVTTHTIRDLPSGTYYFAVTAIDSSGNESELSNEGSKVIP